jgi:1-acyl-sn-glycerol-3-phosphate acyltransferase
MLRALLRLALVGALLLWGVLCVAFVFPWLGSETRARIKQRWSAALLRALGVAIRPDGEYAHDWPAGLVVANHISFLDIFVINALMKSSFVAKSDVAGWPVIGWLTARTGNLFIERGSRRAAHAMQQRMTDELAGGRRLVIFPEGTSTPGEHVLPFHAALLESAIASGAPVICLGLAYQDAAGRMTSLPAYVGDDSVWACLKRIASSDGIVARVSPAGCIASTTTDRRHLARQAHQRVAAAVNRIHATTT